MSSDALLDHNSQPLNRKLSFNGSSASDDHESESQPGIQRQKTGSNKKTIGMFAGIALLINNITGPGVPALPNMFSESGWVVPTITFIVIWAMSSVSTTMFCEAMRNVPGNDHFRDRIEYTTIVKYYFGKGMYVLSQISLNGALQSLNVISVIQSAQVMDNTIAAIFTKTCGFNLSPFAISAVNSSNVSDLVGDGVFASSLEFVSCIDSNDVSNGNPWGCHVVLSAGFVVALAITVPMGIFNLDDNMIVQVVAFVLTVVCWIIWFIAYFFARDDGQWTLDAVATGRSWNSQAGVLGNVLFNFGFVTTIPSWVNEKKPSVSINKSVWFSTFMCNVIFFFIGIPGALVFQYILAGPATNLCEISPDDGQGCQQDILAVLKYTSDIAPGHPGMPPSWNGHPVLRYILLTSVYMFPIVAVLSSIPVFSIVIKYNLEENGFSKPLSFVWGVIFPWIIALPLLYMPDSLNQFITFSSLLFVSITDFIIPWILYIILMVKEKKKRAKRNGKTRSNLEDVFDGDSDDLSVLDKLGERSSISSFPEPGSDRKEKELGNTADEQEDPFQDVAEHYTFPPSWDLSPQSKILAAAVLVVLMIIASVAGTVLSIVTSATTSWNCAAVSA